ncbi:MAG: non-ribosomal peptide synthetase, partial [bacterium]|nr:non-ribosomal peptide synthetase [bacterium]
SDGLSTAVFIDEFVRLYEGEELKPLKLRYKDFSQWQNTRGGSGVLAAQEAYWLKQFENGIPDGLLPTDFPRPKVRSFQGSMHQFEIDKQLTVKIREVISRTGSTLHQFLLAAYVILISRYSGSEDIVVGCPVTGRSHHELQRIIGMFVNMQALRARPCGGKTFLDFLQEVRDVVFRAYENQDYQFEDLVKKLGVQADAGRNPLFDAAFNITNLNREDGSAGELQSKVAVFPIEREVSVFDITLRADERLETIGIGFEYSTVLFKVETIEKYGKRYREILEQVVEKEGALLKEIAVRHNLITLKSDVFEEEEDDEDFRF